MRIPLAAFITLLGSALAGFAASDDEVLARLIAEEERNSGGSVAVAAAPAVETPKVVVAEEAEQIPEVQPEVAEKPVAAAEQPAVKTNPTVGKNPTVKAEAEAPAAPLAPVRGIPKLTVQPESVVEIAVAEDATLDGTYEVNSSSAISFGYVGMVFLPNMTEDEAAVSIMNTLRERGFRSATVKVRIIKASYDIVRVSGAVGQPCDLKIGPGSSIPVQEALRRAGMLKTQAKGARIKVVRGGLKKAIGLEADGEEYSLVGQDGRPSIPDVQLCGTDWAHVFPGEEGTVAGLGEKEIMVLGEVGQPGLVRFANNEACTMMRLLFKITLSKWADTRHVAVLRKGSDGGEKKIVVDVRRLLQDGDPESDITLENGDRVIVKERRLF